MVASVIYGCYTGGMAALNIVSGAYTVDAYRDLSVELVIIVMIVKNFLFYGMSYFFNNWVASAGPATVFNIVGGIVLFCSVVLTIPIYVFGKRYVAMAYTHKLTKNLLLTFSRIRSWWARADVLTKMHLN